MLSKSTEPALRKRNQLPNSAVQSPLSSCNCKLRSSQRVFLGLACALSTVHCTGQRTRWSASSLIGNPLAWTVADLLLLTVTRCNGKHQHSGVRSRGARCAPCTLSSLHVHTLHRLCLAWRFVPCSHLRASNLIPAASAHRLVLTSTSATVPLSRLRRCSAWNGPSRPA